MTKQENKCTEKNYLNSKPVVYETTGLVVLFGGALLMLSLQVFLDPPLGEHLPAHVARVSAHVTEHENNRLAHRICIFFPNIFYIGFFVYFCMSPPRGQPTVLCRPRWQPT